MEEVIEEGEGLDGEGDEEGDEKEGVRRLEASSARPILRSQPNTTKSGRMPKYLPRSVVRSE